MAEKDGIVEEMVSVGVAAAAGSVPVRPVENVRVIGQQAAESVAKRAPRQIPQGATTEAPPEGTKLLGREQILAERSKPRKRLFAKAFGGMVCVQAMSTRERDSYERSLTEVIGTTVRPTTDNIRAKLVARSIVDENGARCFTDEDAELLGELPASEMEGLWQAAAYLSNVTEADVQELAGNSEGNRGDTSA